MKTGQYILGCSLLTLVLVFPIFIVLSKPQTLPIEILIISMPVDMFVLGIGWFFVLNSEPSQSNWKFEKLMAKKFGKI